MKAWSLEAVIDPVSTEDFQCLFRVPKALGPAEPARLFRRASEVRRLIREGLLQPLDQTQV
jgi:hypothetical protein